MGAKQRNFEKQLWTHGCGYWDVCSEHSCPCEISIHCSDAYDESIHQALVEEGIRVAALAEEKNVDGGFVFDFEKEDPFWGFYDDYDPYEESGYFDDPEFDF